MSEGAKRPESQPVMGLSEVADYIKVSRQAISGWRTHRREFPKPYAELKSGPIWLTTDIVRFKKVRTTR